MKLSRIGLFLVIATFVIVFPLAFFVEPNLAMLGMFTFLPGLGLLIIGGVVDSISDLFEKKKTPKDFLSEVDITTHNNALRYKAFATLLIIFAFFSQILSLSYHFNYKPLEYFTVGTFIASLALFLYSAVLSRKAEKDRK